MLWDRMLCRSKYGLMHKSLGWQELILFCCMAQINDFISLSVPI